MLNFLAHNPWRAPSWRWLRAGSILEGGPSTTARRDGPEGYRWIKRIERFRRQMQGAPSERLQAELALEYPDLFWAHWVWEQNESSAKWAIEAHILAREKDREIAFHTGCGQEIITAYEAVFFNVREKLDFREYIINVVMGDSVARGMQERHYDLLWKLFGYNGGPHVLAAMIGQLVNPVWANRPENVPAFFQDTALNLMKKKAAVAALTVPINNSTHLHLIEAFVKYVEIERTTDSMGQAQDQILQNINAMLTAIPFNVGSRVAAEQSKLPFDNTAAALRQDELMCVAAGYSLPGQKMLQELKFPEANVHETAKQGS